MLSSNLPLYMGIKVNVALKSDNIIPLRIVILDIEKMKKTSAFTMHV